MEYLMDQALSNLLLVSLNMTMSSVLNPVIVSLRDTNDTQIVALWSRWNIQSPEQAGTKNAVCLIDLGILDNTMMDDLIDKVALYGQNGPIVIIAITDSSVNVFEWFEIKQVYTYTLDVGYFHMMTIENR
jgi:hypothetical protein